MAPLPGGTGSARAAGLPEGSPRGIKNRACLRGQRLGRGTTRASAAARDDERAGEPRATCGPPSLVIISARARRFFRVSVAGPDRARACLTKRAFFEIQRAGDTEGWTRRPTAGEGSGVNRRGSSGGRSPRESPRGSTAGGHPGNTKGDSTAEGVVAAEFPKLNMSLLYHGTAAPVKGLPTTRGEAGSPPARPRQHLGLHVTPTDEGLPEGTQE